MLKENGKKRHLGTFASAEEAALSYARHVRPARAAVEAAEARVAVPQPLTADDAKAAKSDQPKRSVWSPQWKPSWKPPNGHQLLPQDSSAALGRGSPVAAATVVALMPAERANSFEWVTAHKPAPAHEPSPLPSLSPQAKKKPKSKFKWKPLKIAKASR